MGNYIYILECADGSWYTGWTTDPERRAAVHNSGRGAKYTRSRRPVRLLYTEEYETATQARKRECEIKRLTRAQKEALVYGGAQRALRSEETDAAEPGRGKAPRAKERPGQGKLPVQKKSRAGETERMTEHEHRTVL